MKSVRFTTLLLGLSLLSSPAGAQTTAPTSQPAAQVMHKLEAIRPDEWAFWDRPHTADEVLLFLKVNYYLSDPQVAPLREEITRLNFARNNAMLSYLKKMEAILDDLDAWRAKLAKESEPDRETFQALMDRKWKLRSESPASPLPIIDLVQSRLTQAEWQEVLHKRAEKAGEIMTEIRKTVNVPASQPTEQDRQRLEEQQKTEKLRVELDELRKKNQEILNKRATLTPPASMPTTMPNNPFLKQEQRNP